MNSISFCFYFPSSSFPQFFASFDFMLCLFPRKILFWGKFIVQGWNFREISFLFILYLVFSVWLRRTVPAYSQFPVWFGENKQGAPFTLSFNILSESFLCLFPRKIGPADICFVQGWLGKILFSFFELDLGENIKVFIFRRDFDSMTLINDLL